MHRGLPCVILIVALSVTPFAGAYGPPVEGAATAERGQGGADAPGADGPGAWAAGGGVQSESRADSADRDAGRGTVGGAAASEGRPLGVPSDRAGGGGDEASPGATSPRAMAWSALRVVVSLGVVIVLILLLAAGLRRAARAQGGLASAAGPGGRAPSGVLEVLGRYPLGMGRTLILLKMDRRVLLLSQTTGGRVRGGGSITTLCEVTDPEEVASLLVQTRDADGESISERFRSMLGRFDRESEAAERGGGGGAVGGGGGESGVWGRRRVRGEAGDLAELWDDRGASPAGGHGESGGLGSAIAQRAEGLGSLRRRLEGLRQMDDSWGGR